MDKTDGIVRRMKNLRMYQGMSEDEIRAKYLEKKERDALTPKGVDKSYEAKYKEKLAVLQDEFAVDMNDANDREMLQSLVRHMLQSEAADDAIRAIHERGSLNRMDFLNLKNLGEYQAGVDRTVADLQDKLGISRKLRKEKATDDIPQWIEERRAAVKAKFDRSTTKIECPKCNIELLRFWINFPRLENNLSTSLTCWKCHEKVVYNM